MSGFRLVEIQAFVIRAETTRLIIAYSPGAYMQNWRIEGLAGEDSLPGFSEKSSWVGSVEFEP